MFPQLCQCRINQGRRSPFVVWKIYNLNSHFFKLPIIKIPLLRIIPVVTYEHHIKFNFFHMANLSIDSWGMAASTNLIFLTISRRSSNGITAFCVYRKPVHLLLLQQSIYHTLLSHFSAYLNAPHETNQIRLLYIQ